MSLYECTRCHAVENTGAAGYYARKLEGEPPLCSECATGEWHGLFPKRLVSETNYVTNASGFLEPPGGWPPPGAK
jgi:hypothetical protein